MYCINSPKVIHETIDGETVIVNLDTGNYYSIDGVGVEVWSSISKGSSEAEIVRNVALKYSGKIDYITESIHKFMKELESEGLISAAELEMQERAAPQTEKTVGSDSYVFEAPVLNRYTDMQEVLLLDPIHDVDETGWPSPKNRD